MSAFSKALDASGLPVRGLWVRNGIYYLQKRIEGRNASKIRLSDAEVLARGLTPRVRPEIVRRQKLCADCGREASGVCCRACSLKRRKRLTLSDTSARLAEIKTQIIAARRAGDDNRAALLSAEKERLKKQVLNKCSDCGIPVSRNGQRCRLCSRRHRYYGKQLAA